MVAAIARHLDDGDAQRTNERSIGVFALLVGSLQLARAVTDPVLSEQILSAAYTHALTIAGAQPGSAATPDRESR
jgi:hypothetical protein